MDSNSEKALSQCLAIAFGLCFVTACQTTEQLAPPVSQLATSTARSRPSSTSLLEHGGQTYLTRSTECHSLQPVRNYSAERWPAIVQTMAKRAKLSETERSQLLAYLLAVKQTAATPPL